MRRSEQSGDESEYG